MKILFVADAASIHTKKWVEYFRDRGDEVHIATFQPSVIDGVLIHVMPTFGLGKIGYFQAIRSLPEIYASIKPDLVHAHYLTSYGFLAAFSKMHPLVLTAWGSDVLLAPKESLILRFFVRYALRRADVVTLLAEHMRPTVELLGGGGRIVTTPFGVDTQLFFPAPKSSERDGVVKLISTRRFDDLYDVETLIRALALIFSKERRLSVDLVGDGPLRSSLMELVKDLGIAECIRFHGNLCQNDLSILLAQSDLYVTSALSDGGSVSLAEAFSCGCFPIATDIPANKQWIIHGKNGYLYQPGNIGDLALNIERALDNMWLCHKVQLENRALAVAEMDWQVCAERMVNVYQVATGVSRNLI